MSVERAAFITLHACPLAAPGQGKSGGMNVYVRQLAAALGEMGMKIDIFTREHLDVVNRVETIGPNVRVIHLKAGEPDAHLGDLYALLPDFLEQLNDFREEEGLEYDVVHSHYWLSAWVGRELSQAINVPHVVTFHTLSLIKMQSRAGEIEQTERPVVEAEVMATAGRIIAFSPHERDAMARLYGADARKVSLVPCGVDLEVFRPLNQKSVRSRLGLNGEKILLYVGRVEPIKGLDLLVETAAQMDSAEGVRMMVVGADVNGDREMDRVKQLAKERDMEDKIDFVGQVDHDDLALYYNAADVCVVPSYYESFGLVALESMACGTPVVATRVGGLSTIIQHGRTGYLKSWRCPEAFANSVEMIISSDGLQQSMGEAARKRAEGMGWDNVASLMWDEYSVLTEHPAKDDNKY
ncbi:MAG TPA: glycosyltransferase family 1 protein [Dehalococcoidia bacterium]|nr:glycosyltransferase family 1 protein [Dehalococcoidia bacterium]HIL30260.1 glycosyltransferase family 1 protein [Dehalococcoidia bacterium]